MNAIDVIMEALPDTDTPEQIASLMDNLNRAKKTVEHTLDAINARGEALILSGQPIPGYAYQPGKGKGKFANREQAIQFAFNKMFEARKANINIQGKQESEI